MPYMKRFGYVDGRIVYTYRFTCICSAYIVYNGSAEHDVMHECRAGQVKIQISARDFRMIHKVASCYARRKIRGYHLRTFMQLLGVLETRKSVVSVSLRRDYYIFLAHKRTVYSFAYLFLVVHALILTQISGFFNCF